MGRLLSKEFGDWAEYSAKAIYRKENGQWVQRNWSDLDGRKYLYEWLSTVEGPIGYVSFGDSIAAGHAINDGWASNYGEGSQYGKNGNTETVIVPGCYTDIIRNDLVSIYGGSNVFVKSFARSGDTVADMMDKLTHETVRSALAKANLVTVCIGANDVLQPALMELEKYINTGDLSNVEAIIAANMVNLNTDSNPTSFVSLFNRLASINPDAKYVFTTIYNPYKYLHIEEGRNGFFGPLLDLIPNMDIDVDEIIEDQFLGGTDLSYYDMSKGKWVSIELELDLDAMIKEGLLLTTPFQLVFNRINGLGDWAEVRVTELNTILRNKINAYHVTNPNFSIVDTKAAFDLFPDKTDSSADVDYSDLVNVEFTRTYDTAKMDWGALWRGSNAASFWTGLAWKYLSFHNALPSTDIWDYVSFDLEGFAADLVEQIIQKVILPNVDPHPEPHGHQVLDRSFTNGLGLVRYVANGGSHVPGEVVYAGAKLAETDPTWVGCSFGGWYTDPALTQAQDLNRTDYADRIANFTLADLVSGSTVKAKTPKTTTLYAKWSPNK